MAMFRWIPPLLEARPRFYMPAAANTQTTDQNFILLKPTLDASTQTTDEDFILLEPIHDAITQTTEEDFILLEPIRDASTQTTDEDFILLEPIHDAITQTTEEDFILLEPTRDAGTQMTEENLILLEQTRDAGTRETDEDVPKNFEIENGSRFHPIPNDTQIANKVHVRNRKINTSNYQGITYNSRDHKRSRHEISEINSHVIETNGQVISTNGGRSSMGYDLTLVSRMAFDNNCQTVIHQDSMNIVQGNRRMQIFGNLNRNRLLAISHFENVASNITISQSSENENTSCKISVSKSSAESKYSDIDIPVFPGSSSFPHKKITSKMCGKKFQFKFPSEVKSVMPGRKKRVTCWICNTEFAEHVVKKNFYKCCVCRYISDIQHDLQMHTETHGPEPFSCKICGEGFTEKGSHDSKQTCNLCWKDFQCKALLEQHCLVHEDYYTSYCRICRWKIHTHIVMYRENKVYRCCGCNYRTSHKKHLLQHLHTHVGSKPVRCDKCGKRFTEKKYLDRHSQNHIITPRNVKISGVKFRRIVYLDEHRLEKHSQA